MKLVLGSGPVPRLKRGATVRVAYSGGLDSTVLLHLLKASGRPLRAVHVNHQLQPDAVNWVKHCRALCRRLKVPIDVADVKVDRRHPDGPEAAAREARYEAFRKLLRPGDWLATAHHLDDQAETVLLRLLRGAGVRGLSAMQPASEFACGFLWRPLLQFPRAELLRYATRHRLPWIDDVHNSDPRFSRSFLRAKVFPALRKRWPETDAMLARSAAHCLEAAALLDQLAAVDMESVVPADARTRRLSVRGLLLMSEPRRNNLLRFWTASNGFEVPPFDALARLEREVLRTRPDASPLLAWGCTELRRYRDSLYLMNRLPAPPGQVSFDWDGRRDLELPAGCGQLVVQRRPREPLDLKVGFPRGGERFKPVGARHTRTLRNLFQEGGVPGWVRERTPLIYCQGGLGAVGDRWQGEDLVRAARTWRFRFAWRHELPGDPAS